MQSLQQRSACVRHARVGRARCTTVQVRAAKTADGPTLAIVGVSGAVGQEFLTVLKERNFPYSDIKMLASARSAGKKQEFDGHTYTVEELTADSFKGIDIALFSAGGSISKSLGPVAAAAGAVVVDNSSAFRMTDGVPLVIPEVNPEDMAHIKLGSGKGAIIANPNCSTIIALMAVTPLHRVAGVKRMVVSTYQAASGAGAAAMEELRQQTLDVLEGRPAQPKIFPQQYAFNLFSHNSKMDVELGYNEEEVKMMKETHKIWKNKQVKITATCIRVPIMRAHAESINLEFERDISEAEALAALEKAAGVSVINDREKNRFPTPLDATTRDDVYVGRVRRDISRDDNKGLDLFVCGDQIKKGAALNAVQIAELLLK
ncbi:aspartate semialdehyde dehydrogenase [Haematococcus lacustris]